MGALHKLWCARDNASKVTLVQESDFRDKILPAIGVFAIAATVFALHIYEDKRFGLFENLWSSLVAVVVSCVALALWLAVENTWRNRYVNYILARRWGLTWFKIFLPYILFLLLVAVGITTYKVTY